jgi:hypothetical protein
MPANNDFPVLNGIAPSWADVVVKAAATGAAILEMKDIAAINSGRTVEVGEQRAGGRVMKRTTGSGSQECSITLYRDGFQKMLRNLKALAPMRGDQRLLTLVVFGIQYMYTPPGSTEIYERRIKGCRILTDAMNDTEGTEAQKVEVGISTVEIADVIDGEEVLLI